jgi:hypothetical protein
METTTTGSLLRLGTIGSALALALAAGAAGVWGSSPASASRSATSISAAKGDIPDTAVYLTYRGRGFSLQYVEGWSIRLQRSGVLVNDQDSSEVVAIQQSRSRYDAYASSDLAHLSRSLPKFHLVLRQKLALPAGAAIRAQYHTLSAQDPVTGRRVNVLVDRYYIAGSRRVGVLTLATPLGVDNVDAFRRIARSFRWK